MKARETCNCLKIKLQFMLTTRIIFEKDGMYIIIMLLVSCRVSTIFNNVLHIATTCKRMFPKIVVFGGNGFVGQKIVKAAVGMGVNVVAINRSGRPDSYVADAEQTASVSWKKGDILQSETWRNELVEAAGVISCVGAFGSNEVLLR